MTNDEIMRLCMKSRWGTTEKQVCSHCGALDQHYLRKQRRRTSRRPASSCGSNPQWQCRHCFEIFSITSDTLFHQTQLPLRSIVLGLALVLGTANGMAALALSCHLGVTPKTTFLMVHRFREAMAEDQPEVKFTGIAQMDGGYFGGKPYKPNRKMRVTPEQLKRRWGKKPIGETDKPWVAMGMTRRNYLKRANKRTILVATHSNAPAGKGARQVAVVVSRSENEQAISYLAGRFIAPGSLLMTDEASAYNVLDRNYEHATVSHADEFCTADGVNDNHCEAFFSRLRRAEYGIYHGMRPRYLHLYAWEAAWRHNHRLLSKSEQVERLLSKCFSMGPSTRFRGYYDGRGCRAEVLV